MNWVVHHGDCLDVLRTLPSASVGAVVTDPPYGMAWRSDTNRFTGRTRGRKQNDYGDIVGDDKPFDPSPWLTFPKVCLWGFNHFASRLPVGTTLVWIKRNEPQYEAFLSDAELGWIKGGHGVYCRRILSAPPTRIKEGGLKNCVAHPTQKPVALMKWYFERMRLKPGDTVFDPFCGSGTTGVAAVQCGLNFIGCEIHEPYVDIARNRIAAAEQGQSLPLLDGAE